MLREPSQTKRDKALSALPPVPNLRKPNSRKLRVEGWLPGAEGAGSGVLLGRGLKLPPAR